VPFIWDLLSAIKKPGYLLGGNPAFGLRPYALYPLSPMMGFALSLIYRKILSKFIWIKKLVSQSYIMLKSRCQLEEGFAGYLP